MTEKTKFKPGDRVRALVTMGDLVAKGHEYVVRSLDADGDPIFTNEEVWQTLGWGSEDFELIESPDSQIAAIDRALAALKEARKAIKALKAELAA